MPLGTRGGILAKVDLPADGEYHINIADMANGLWGSSLEYENPLVVTLDNNGRIARLEQYLDSAGLGPLIAALGTP